jgi:peptidoglycan hydrolase FlgJ
VAFNPRTDVVLEVLSAADPTRASVAAQRLNALAGPNASTASFAADLERAAAPANALPPPAASAGVRSPIVEAGRAPDKSGQAKTQFEAMMLNSFVGEMLPKDTGEVFGQGMAGDMWRSMLSEQVSMQIAKSGKLGLARRLFATHEVAGRSESAPEARKAHGASAAQMSANVLSSPATAEPTNSGVLFAGRKST